MALVGEETIKSVRGSLLKSLKYLRRVSDQVRQVLGGAGFQGHEPVTPESVDELQEQTTILRQELSEFRDYLARLEQLAVNSDDHTYDQELDQWGDIEFDSKGLLVKAERAIQKCAPVFQLPPFRASSRADDASSVVSGVGGDGDTASSVVSGPIFGDAGGHAPPSVVSGSGVSGAGGNPPPSVVSGVGGPGNPSPSLNENFTRLLSLLEQQQQTGSRGTGGQVSIAQAKLPKLELPKFSGDILKWKPFWDRFEASVDKNPKLANVDKLSYLISQLEKEPLTMVESLTVINENYPVAVQKLKKHYGDSRMVIALLYKKLNEKKPVRNEVASLRRFAAEIDCMLGSLGALGQDTSGDNFSTMILSKLPGPVVIQLELAKEVKTNWTVALVREKLTDYLARIEMATKLAATNPNLESGRDGHTADSLFGGARKQKGGKRQGDPKPKTGPGAAKQPPPNSKSWGPVSRAPSCIYCGLGGHWSDQCKKFATADDRFKHLGDHCSNCLGTNHRRRDCHSQKPCFHCGKVGSHHSSLCFDKFGRGKTEGSHIGAERQEAGTGGSDTENHGDGNNGSSENGLLASGEEVNLQTALVLVSAHDGGSEFHSTRMLLDPGCNRTYGSQYLKKRLGLKTKPGPSLTVNRFGSNTPLQVPTETAKIRLKTLDGRVRVIEISIIPHISGSLSRIPVNTEKLQSLQSRLTLADTVPDRHESSPIHLLLGSDYYLDFVTGEKIQVAKGLYLLGSAFGYILTGRVRSDDRDPYHMSMCGFDAGTLDALVEIEPSPKADPISPKGPDISSLWTLEGIGVTDDPLQSDDQKAIIDFEENVTFKNGRYSVSLPWNERASELQSDYGLCVGRLKSLVRRVGSDNQLWSSYKQVMQDQCEKGVIEKVNLEPIDTSAPVHYIPHHPVVDPLRETTKVRVVYDGSAKTRNEHASLNECLYRGPILLEDLVGVLLRFRLSPVAIIADIEKAFLQIGINGKDRDMVRLLWLKDPDLKQVENNIQVYRFARVLFGLNCSPSLLAQVVRHHLTKLDTDTARAILSNLYVDNVFMGVTSADQAKKFYGEAKEAFKSASMNLRSWASNSADLLQSIPDVDRVKSSNVKVLGLQWNTSEDTVWGILSGISSVFDPLGWFSPCTVPSKCLLQTLCTIGGLWDSEVSNPIKQEWIQETESLEAISSVTLPRTIPTAGALTLAAFCDASTSSFATALYLISGSGEVWSSNLLMAKSRLNPTKKLSVPRLELMGVLIGTRLLKFAAHQLRLQIGSMVLFCDSTCVLSWIKSQKQLDTFVRNRLREITTKVPGLAFRYVKTDHNPADWATRGKKPDELTRFWWHGPEFLARTRSNWPIWDFPEFVPDKFEPKSSVIFEAGLVANENLAPPFGIKLENHSSLTRLLRITAWCSRFVSLLKKKVPVPPGNLTAADLQLAKDMWDAYVQEKHFSLVISAIKAGKKHPMSHMGLFLDDKGLIRCKGRMGNAALVWASKFPKLLPPKESYTRLVINSKHCSLGHCPINQTLNSLKREYWVPRGRARVIKVLSSCTVCRKATGKPYATPPMPELPMSRVRPRPAFEACGVDYFGPLKLQGHSGPEKAWVCLFTCLSTRAVHLELVADLSAVEFLMAFRRFVARRGKPNTMVSDNGPQFKVVSQVADKEWSAALIHPDVTNFCTSRGIAWSFITEYAPFMGGVYERLVGVVKQSLRKTVGAALLSSQQFRTLLCECEAVVNCRPLTYVDSDVDTFTVLTPAHFLNPHQATVSPEVSLNEEDYSMEGFTKQELIKTWQKGQNLLDEFWRVWLSDYLNMLREKSVYQHRHDSRLSLKPRVGHLVLIKESCLPRGSWRIGRLVELHESADNSVRSVTVQLPSGRKLRRPVGNLVPFETEIARPKDPETAEKSAKSPLPAAPKATQHKVVLAKLRGFPNWPAKVLADWSLTPLGGKTVPKDHVAVHFFGDEKFAFVPRTGISKFDPKGLVGCKKKDLREAITLAEQYLTSGQTPC